MLGGKPLQGLQDIGTGRAVQAGVLHVDVDTLAHAALVADRPGEVRSWD
ncbi:hypothetical protein [Propionibacterium sp.]